MVGNSELRFYKLAQEELAQIDNGIQAIMMMAVQIFLLFPIAVGALELEVAMRPIVWATIAFLATMGYGIYGRFFRTGSISPYSLYLYLKADKPREYLEKSSDAIIEKGVALRVISLILCAEIWALLIALLAPAFDTGGAG